MRGELSPTILIVDDAEDVCALLGRVFRAAGFTVHTASAADEAWARLKATPEVSVLLSDLVMPGETGTSLLRRAGEVFPGLLRGAMTAVLRTSEASLLARQGVELVFQKPFVNFSPLVAAVTARLAARAGLPFVLVADDDRDFRNAARRTLARDGLAVACVSHIESAEAVLREWPPALVLADMFSDRDRSLALCRSHSGRVRFVSCSGAPVEERSAYREAGAHGLVAKPLDTQGLIAAVRQHLT